MPPVIAAVAAIGSAITSALGVATLAAAAGSMLSVRIGALPSRPPPWLKFAAFGQTEGHEQQREIFDGCAHRSIRAPCARPWWARPRWPPISATVEFTDSQTHFHRFIVVACSPRSTRSAKSGSTTSWRSVGGGVTGTSGYLCHADREGSSANAINISARMGTTRRWLTGCAYVHLEMQS